MDSLFFNQSQWRNVNFPIKVYSWNHKKNKTMFGKTYVCLHTSLFQTENLNAKILNIKLASKVESLHLSFYEK